MPSLGRINASYLRALFDKFGLRMAATPFELSDTVTPVCVVDAGEPYYLDPLISFPGVAAPADTTQLAQFIATRAGVYQFIVACPVSVVSETLANGQVAVRGNVSASGASLFQMNFDVRNMPTLSPIRFKAFLPATGTLTLLKVGNATALTVYCPIIIVESWYGN